jgi:hypothetical protein
MIRGKKIERILIAIVAVSSVLVDVPVVGGTLDIDMIMIMTECEYVDGLPDGGYPWDFEISVLVSDPGTLHHIDVTKPDASSVTVTIYETEPGLWEFDPDKYASLEALRLDYAEGTYTLEFCDSDSALLKTVYLDYSNLSVPASPVDFTYPSSNGQTGVSTNPTFMWTIAADAADFLALGIDDEDTGEQVYGAYPVSMTTLSWSPGPLPPNHEYHLDVTVSEVKNWVGPDLPTMTVGDDEFTYYLTFDYINTISFTTIDMPPEDAAAEALINVQAVINQLPPESLHNKNSANALINKIDAALAMIDAGLYQETLDKLENDILKKTDGCADTGMPDRNDWIITCEAQAEVYPIVVHAIELLESLI